MKYCLATQSVYFSIILTLFIENLCTWTVHSNGAVDKADCIFTEEQDSHHNECQGYDTKLSDDEAPVLEV